MAEEKKSKGKKRDNYTDGDQEVPPEPIEPIEPANEKKDDEEFARIKQELRKTVVIPESKSTTPKISVVLSNGKTVDVDPDNDKIWSVLCVKCKQHYQNLNFRAANKVKDVLERKGCLCDNVHFIVSLTDELKRLAGDLNFKLEEYDQKFRDFLFLKYILNRAENWEMKGSSK